MKVVNIFYVFSMKNATKICTFLNHLYIHHKIIFTKQYSLATCHDQLLFNFLNEDMEIIANAS